MRLPPAALPAVLLAGVVLACGGSERALPTPTLSPPPLDPRLQVLAAGSVALNVAKAGSQIVDASSIASKAGLTQLCADLVFLFSWRAGQGQALRFVGAAANDEFNIGSGSAGQASISACIRLAVLNDGSRDVNGDLRYVIAQVRRE